MRRSLLFLFTALLVGGITHAQIVAVTANTGTTQLNGLGSGNYHVSEYIYTETEIGAANFITDATAIRRINLFANEIGASTTFTNVKVYLKTVPLTTVSLAAGTYTTTGYTTVFSGSLTVATAGIVSINLSTPFIRAAGTNLQMMIERTDNVNRLANNSLVTWLSANGNNQNANATTSRRYNGTATLSTTTSLTTSAFRVAVEFVNPPPVDAALNSAALPYVIAPSTITCNTTNNFSVVLTNAGTNPINVGAATVTLRLGGANASSTVRSNTTAIPANGTETIVFNNVNTTNPGTTVDSAFVTLAGDTHPLNDTIKNDFSITTNIRVSNNNPAIEDVETTLPVFSYVVTLAGDGRLWGLWEAPPKYKNPDLTDSLGAHGGNSFFLLDCWDGTTSSSGFSERLFSNCITLPATSGSCTSNLSFWLSHDNSYSANRDSMYVSISTDKGVTWNRIGGYARYGASYTVPTWAQETINLSAYQGQTFQIGFEGVSKYGNVIGLDDITISSNCILPITLSSFKGERKTSFNLLQWTTAMESNNAGFELQRSIDGINFSKLAFVASKANNGNSATAVSYSFDDTQPFKSNGYYRLKQIDKDSKSILSSTILIKGAPLTGLSVSTIYPNPVKNSINIVATVTEQENIAVTILDFAGKILNTYTKQTTIGDNLMQINVGNLSAGNYLLKVTSAKGETITQRFSK